MRDKILKNISLEEALELKELVSYQDGQIVSRTLVQNAGVSITLFAFDTGEEISAHESKGDALVMAEVYAAGEAPIVAADGRSLARALRVVGKIEPVFVENIADMPQAILDIARDKELNDSMPDDSKRVPFTNMVYVGDGLSDVPCMKMMRAYG